MSKHEFETALGHLYYVCNSMYRRAKGLDPTSGGIFPLAFSEALKKKNRGGTVYVLVQVRNDKSRDKGCQARHVGVMLS